MENKTIRTITVKFTVDMDTLNKVESDYKGDYINQIRSALGWAEESGVSIAEISPDPLAAFIEQEVPFRLEEFFDIENPTQEQLDAVYDVMDNTENWIDYDRLDMNISNALYELDKAKENK